MTVVDRVNPGLTAVLSSLLRCSRCTGGGENSRVQPASPIQFGIEVTNDIPKHAKTGKQKSARPVDGGELSLLRHTIYYYFLFKDGLSRK